MLGERPLLAVTAVVAATLIWGCTPAADEVHTPAADKVHNTLVVTTCQLNVGDVSTWTRCYNGTVPGPTLRVNPGQQMTITLVNELHPFGNVGEEILNDTGYGEP